MEHKNVIQIVKDVIFQIAKEQSKTLNAVENNHSIIGDLGFSSIEIATLISLLETNLKVDPFAMGTASITDIRTVSDLSEAYEKCLK